MKTGLAEENLDFEVDAPVLAPTLRSREAA